MASFSASGISGDSGRAQRIPLCVAGRARELLDLAILKFLAVCLGATVVVQMAALFIALLMPPHLHFIPEVRR